MTSRDFCYWLQGYFEIMNATGGKKDDGCLYYGQVESIKKHLAMVFKHEIDPSMGPEKHQQELNAIHSASGGPFGPTSTVPGAPVMRC